MKTVKQIIFTKPYVAEYLAVEELDFAKIDEKAVVVKTHVSTVSAGTERANFVGEEVVSIAKDAKTPFPRTVGYSSAGEVVAVGSAVTKVKAGDRVVVYWGKHKNYNVVPEENVVKIEQKNVMIK